eukprot:scaffold413806_cov55-Attheya_sp.AAC.3
MSSSDGEVSFCSRLADCFEELPPRTQVATKERERDNEIDLEFCWHNNDDDDFDDYSNNGQVQCTTDGVEFNNDEALSVLDYEVDHTSVGNEFKNNKPLSTMTRITLKVPRRSPRIAQIRLPDQYHLGYFHQQNGVKCRLNFEDVLVTFDAMNKKFSLFDENNVLMNVPSDSIRNKLKTVKLNVH